MAAALAAYTCDKCRTRKVACTREVAGCQRCKKEDTECTYSRSGIIRRNRKRKLGTNDTEQSSPDKPRPHRGSSGIDAGRLQSHLAPDIAVLCDHLRGQDISQGKSPEALASLADACAAVWHDASEFEEADKSYFLFEDRATSWIEVFISAMNRGRPLLFQPPPEVLDHLRASRPQQVHDRAWLVMYYSIILSMVSSTEPENESMKGKLRCNLWLALNNVRLLLEPSEPNIQALLLLACHVEEFTTPSLCWLLTSIAGRMLQALGVKHRRFDPQTRERRLMLFWQVNLIDKGLALIFGRPPTLHSAMARELALPSLDQLLPLRPHTTSPNVPASFGAHYIYQMMSLSRVMADIWNCLYEDRLIDEDKVEATSRDLESWYRQAKELLEAAALVERPFLGARSVASINIGLTNLCSTFHYLSILLARSSKRMRLRCIDSSKQMLHLLKDLVSDSEEPFNGIVWQLICGPFTPFLALFGEILSNGKGAIDENLDALAAMEQLPLFLKRMSERNSFAAKLERLAVVLLQHAKSVIQAREPNLAQAVPSSGDLNDSLPDPWLSPGGTLNWESFLDTTMGPAFSGQTHIGGQDAQPGDFAYNFFGDAMVDWIGLEHQV